MYSLCVQIAPVIKMHENPSLSPTVTFFQLALLLWALSTVQLDGKSEISYSHTTALTPSTSTCTVNTYSITHVMKLHKHTPISKCATSFRNISSYILLIVVATSADIELNPGPQHIKHPCGICGKAVTWKQKGIRCDKSECEQWYHIKYQNMRSTIYEQMNSSSWAWECLKCAVPNFSTTLFDLHDISRDNSFSNLNNTSDDSSDILSPGIPLALSSPQKKSSVKHTKIKPLRVISVNCQSISNKKEYFEQLLKQHSLWNQILAS